MDAGLDASGNIFLAGTTTSPDFPNAFIAKLNPATTALLYSVIPGNSQSFTRIAVEPAGAAHFLTNASNDNVTITGTSLIPTLSGISSAIAFGRLSPLGNLLDSSFWYAPGLASQPSDAGPSTVGLALTLAAPGTIVFGGYTTASGLPVTPGAVQTTHASPGQSDGFLSRISYTSTCAYTVSANAITAPVAGASTTLTVTTTPGCPWAASASAPWIETQILSDSQLRVSVAPVNGPARTGSLFVAGKTIPVTQNQSCTYGLRFAIPSFPATGGQLSADIIAGVGCPWTPTSDQPWLTLSNAGQTLTGPQSIALTATIYYGAQPRTATLTVAPGVTATVRQDATSCRYTVTPSTISLYPGSRDFSVNVATTPGCLWGGSALPSWISPQQSFPTYGAGAYSVRVEGNIGPARSATILVAGAPVVVNQAASVGAPTLINAPIPNFQGLHNTVSFTATDQDGAADIGRVYFLIHPDTTIPSAACHGFYDVAARAFFLYSDGLSQLLGPTGVLQNSQCQLSTPASNASGSGAFLSLNLDLTLQPTFAAAPHNVYVWAVDRQGNNTGWINLAAWRQSTVTPPQPPTVRVFAIPTLTGPTQDIAITVEDPNGGTNIDRIYFLVNPTADVPANSCHGYFDLAANAVFLYNDPLTALSAPLTLARTGTVQNSQCRIDGSRSSASASTVGTTANLNLNITLTGAFTGKPQTVFAWALDQQQLGTGWVPVANWRAATLDNPPTLSGSAASLSGNPATLGVNVQDLDGPNNIDRVYFLIAPDPTARRNVCFGYYERASNTFFLTDDTGANPTPLATAQNSQCLIPAATATGSGAGISFQVTLRSPFAATIQRYYFLARDLQGNESGWLLGGLWTTGVAPQTQPPAITAATPANPTGSPQTFSFKLTDPDGVTDINRVYFLIASTTTVTPNTCHGFYDRAANAVLLYNDSLTGLASLQNSQCAVGALSATTTATDLNLNLTVTLTGDYATRAQNVYLFVNDNQGKETGWIQTATWIPAVPPAPPSIAGITPAAPTGSPQSFTVTARDPNGATTIQRLYFLINSNTSIPANTCHGFYDRPTNAIYFYNDSLTSLASLQNSQCAISAFSATSAGTDLTLKLTMSLAGAFATGTRNIYLWARDIDGNDTGWIQAGTWAPSTNRPPTVIATPQLAPAGPTAQLALSAQDPDGAANITRLYFLIHSNTAIPANTCHGFYDRPTNAIYLYNDALSALSAPLTPGAQGTIQNSQCAIDGAATTLTTPNSSTLTLSLAITVPVVYRSVPRGIYLWAIDSQQNGTGWIQVGTWVRSAPEVVVTAPPVAYFGAQIDTAFPFRHSDGPANLSRVYFLIAPNPVVTTNSCHGFYDRATGQLNLYNDALTAYSTQPNSRCGVPFRGQSFAIGADFFLPLTITARGAYLGVPLNIYMLAQDNRQVDTGWVRAAAWTQ